MLSQMGDFALCTKEESDERIDSLDGWKHFIPASKRHLPSDIKRHTKSSNTDNPLQDFSALHQSLVAAFSPTIREQVAATLGIHVSALDAFPLGRMSEGEVRRRFDSNLPKILEYICTAIAMALRDHADTRVSPTPRLADAALFATAAEPALGLLDGSIVTAWSSAQLDHTGNQAANDPVAFVLQKLLHDAPHCFEGTTSELIQKAHSLGADEKWKLPSDFPVKASGLGSYLTRNKSVLESSGLTVQKTPRQSKKRELKICFNEIKQTATSAVTVNRPNGHIEVVKINEQEALLNKLETAKRPHINPTHSGLGGMAA